MQNLTITFSLELKKLIIKLPDDQIEIDFEKIGEEYKSVINPAVQLYILKRLTANL